MASPWEKFAPQSSAGPWAKFAAPSDASQSPLGAIQRNLNQGQMTDYNPAPMGLKDWASEGFNALGSGLTRGLVGLPTLPGTLQDLADTGAKKLGSLLYTPEQQAKVAALRAKQPDLMFHAPDYSQVSGAIEKAVPGSIEFNPKTRIGRGIQTAASFVAGPGSATHNAVAGLASEAAGQATEGTAAEPYARVLASLVGGLGKPSATKLAAEGAPTAEAIKTQTDALYNGLRKAGISYDAGAFTNTIGTMLSDLRAKGFRPVGAMKEAFDWVSEAAKGMGQNPSFDDINSLRQAIGSAARDAYRSPDRKSLGKALDMLVGHLDDFEASAPLTSAVPLARDLFDKVRNKARELALRNIKQRAIDEIAAKADTYQSGLEAGIRNGIGNLLRSKRGQQLFKGAERQALIDVAQGGKPLRMLSRFGIDISKLSGNAALLPSLGAASAYGALGPASAALLVAGGTAAKYLSPRITSGRLNQAADAIRSGTLPAATQSAKALADQQRAMQLLNAGRTLMRPGGQ